MKAKNNAVGRVIAADGRGMARAALGLSAFTLGMAAWPQLSHAHVKWFAPFVVGAEPVPLSDVLTSQPFWTAIILVALSIGAVTWMERQSAGQAVWAGLDRVTAPVRRRADDFMRVATGAFFVAIFAVGGVYLTPELHTDQEWVSWTQLLIAAGLFSRKTMPLSAAGIIGLWLIALADPAYEFFHLLDYLPLGLGVAGYLAFAASDSPKFYERRFAVLRWCVAIALMWSSLEKFAYPDWFYPLVEVKPYLTFGIDRDVFIPMAGVAEFAMGFGLIWTPLVRRLSAIALFVIFTAAVYPFGRIDLVGHALIMATLVIILADDSRVHRTAPVLAPLFAAAPARLATALAVLGLSYYGLIGGIYGSSHPADPMHGPTDQMHLHSTAPAPTIGNETFADRNPDQRERKRAL